jgi:hypothetical protein
MQRRQAQLEEINWTERLERATNQAAGELAAAAERLYVAALRYVRAFEQAALNASGPALDHLDGNITLTGWWLQDAADRWGVAFGEYQKRAEIEDSAA